MNPASDHSGPKVPAIKWKHPKTCCLSRNCNARKVWLSIRMETGPRLHVYPATQTFEPKLQRIELRHAIAIRAKIAASVAC